MTDVVQNVRDAAARDAADQARLCACSSHLFDVLHDIAVNSDRCPLCGAYNEFEAHADTCRLASVLTAACGVDCFASKESRTEGRAES